ncbi:MAG: ribosomal RNA small subunit methyltransferase A [Anaerolineaceae bacterium]|nr:ribosomal RNA small subunit methyltransferase A [Anaerolineaceae bacterium]
MDSAIDLSTLSIKNILRDHDIRLKKSLGQNFLSDDHILKKIVQAAGLTKDLTVLEIGPGIGSLTRHIAVQAKEVFAVELDAQLFPALQEVLAPFDNVHLIHDDILKVDLPSVIEDKPYMIIANIPYYITSAVIRRCLETSSKPQKMILTIQKEVARRICQKPGDLSLLALSVQVYGSPQILFDISAGAFFPSPNVDSTVLRVDLYDEPLIPLTEIETFFKWTKAGFQQKRKKLRNSLASGLHMSTQEVEAIFNAANLDPHRRAETLSIEEWYRLMQVRKNKKAVE